MSSPLLQVSAAAISWAKRPVSSLARRRVISLVKKPATSVKTFPAKRRVISLMKKPASSPENPRRTSIVSFVTVRFFCPNQLCLQSAQFDLSRISTLLASLSLVVACYSWCHHLTRNQTRIHHLTRNQTQLHHLTTVVNVNFKWPLTSEWM